MGSFRKRGFTRAATVIYLSLLMPFHRAIGIDGR
jgi:hypothetical protein